MIILFLDPSVNNVGWGTLDTTKKKKKNAWKWGLWKIEGVNYQMKLLDLIQCIQMEIGHFDCLISEWPAFFDNERGQVASRQNYTIDLAGVCMYVAGWFHMDHRNHFPLTASSWKGMVQKHVTSVKFLRTFNIRPDKISEHAIDAVMLGHYWFMTYAEAWLRRHGEEWPEHLQ